MTEDQQGKYLSELSQTGHMARSAQEAGVTMRAVRKERKANPDFDKCERFFYLQCRVRDGMCSLFDESDRNAIHAYMRKLGFVPEK
jgi:hypothetical protein